MEVPWFYADKRGIEANPDLFQGIFDMRSPTNMKEVKQLTGRLTSLSRFLSCMVKKAFLFFAAMRTKEKFEEAFAKVK